MSGFEAQASKAVLDFTGDDDNAMRKKKNLMRWDVKKKKYVKAEQVRMFVTSRNEVATRRYINDQHFMIN